MSIRIQTKGASEIFVLQDTENVNDYGTRQPAAKVFCDVETNGRIKVRLTTHTERGNFIGSKDGYLFSDFVNGNSADAPFADIQSVVDWFDDNTGKNKGGGTGVGGTEIQDAIDIDQAAQDANIAATYIPSVLTGEPAGSSRIPNIVEISQADYDAAEIANALVASTLYIVPPAPSVVDFADVYLDRDSIEPAIIVNGDPFTNWNDKTANGLNATATQVVTLDITNSERNVELGSGYLSFPLDSRFQKTMGVDSFLVAFREGEVIPTTGTMIAKAVAAAADREWSVYYNSANNITVNANGNESNANMPIAAGTQRLILLEFTDTTYNLRVDGIDILVDEPLLFTPRAPSNQVMNIGTRTSGGFQATSGSHISAFVYVSNPTLEQRNIVESELMIN